MPDRPWFKWYPADWRAEPRLKMCSRSARSLWMDMLGLMHESDREGYLEVGGKSPSPRDLAALLGDPVKDLNRWLKELEKAGVFSRDEDGTIYSRRMVKDRRKQQVGRETGKRGGNPTLKGGLKGSVNPTLKGQSHETVNGGLNGRVKASHARDPEARVQSPESDSDLGIRDRDPVDLIQTFDDVTAEVFGEERRRPFPTSTDLEFAREFQRQGLTPAGAEFLFRSQQQRRKTNGEKPIGALKYFRNIVPEHLASSAGRAPEPEVSPECSAEELDKRIALYVDTDHDVWAPTWGDRPTDEEIAAWRERNGDRRRQAEA